MKLRPHEPGKICYPQTLTPTNKNDSAVFVKPDHILQQNKLKIPKHANKKKQKGKFYIYLNTLR